MKVNLLAYVVTGLIAIAAGIAIAGLPSDTADTTVVDPGSVTTTSTSIPVVSTVPFAPASEPSDTEPEITEPSDTEPEITARDPEVTDSPLETSTVPEDNVEETSAPTTTATEPPLADPSELSVAVINATDVGGVAARRAELIAEVGYTQTSTGDATPAQTTAAYVVPGFEREAFWLINAAEVPGAAILPIEEAPEITAIGEFQLILVLGLDAV